MISSYLRESQSSLSAKSDFTHCDKWDIVHLNDALPLQLLITYILTAVLKLLSLASILLSGMHYFVGYATGVNS